MPLVSASFAFAKVQRIRSFTLVGWLKSESVGIQARVFVAMTSRVERCCVVAGGQSFLVLLPRIPLVQNARRVADELSELEKTTRVPN